jgi:hypothetical protein
MLRSLHQKFFLVSGRHPESKRSFADHLFRSVHISDDIVGRVTSLPEWTDYVAIHPIGTNLQEHAIRLIDAVVREFIASSEMTYVPKQYVDSTNTGVKYDVRSTTSDSIHDYGEMGEDLKPDLFTRRFPAPTTERYEELLLWSVVETLWELKSSPGLIND